jgi:hypothetical protein
VTTLFSHLRLRKRHSRRLGAAAALLAASAVTHIVVLLATGGGWEGAVSFRKPITFGISVGLIMWTSGWVMDRLPDRPRMESILAVTLIASGLIEVALITMQAWRGVPSHFNVSTPQDGAIFNLMAVAIGFFSLGLAALLVWALVQRPADRPTRLAVLAGMALVMTGLGLGSWIIGLGLEMTERLGHAPDTVYAGEAGVAKFPHAMALHGIQLFIGASIVTGIAGLTERARLRITRLVVAGYTLLVAWSIVHTNAGRAPADLAGMEAPLLVAGALFLVTAVGSSIIGWRRNGATGAGAAPRPTVTIRK